MPERKELDRPATAILAVSGVVLLLISSGAMYFGNLYCKSPSATCTTAAEGSTLTFDVTWSRAPDGASTGSLADANARGSTNVVVTNASISDAHVRIPKDTCVDTADGRLQQAAATMTWTLERIAANGTRTMIATSDHSYTCADLPASGWDVQVRANPEVAQVAASDDAAAARALWAHPKVHNETATYLLNVTAARNPGPLPPVVPVPGPTFSVRFTVSLDEFKAGLTQHKEPAVGK